MNKRELKKAIKKGHMFIGAVIPISQIEWTLASDIFAIFKQIEADKKRVAIRDLGELHQVIKLIDNGLIMGWVFIIDNQRRISDIPDVGFDESIILEIQEKIEVATKTALASIDVGNKIASDSVIRNVSAKEVMKVLSASKAPRIVSNVVARANGPQADLFFNHDLRKLGGIYDAKKEFTDALLHRIDGCRVDRWINDLDVVLSVKVHPENPEMDPFFEKLQFRIRTASGSIDTSILRCATFSESSFDIEVSVGYDMKKYREVLHLARVINPTAVFSQARERITELEES